MANQKVTARQIIQNRVNGVVKAFQTFKISLKNNHTKVSKKDFDKILEYLRAKSEQDINELEQIYQEREDTFTL
ncbi:MAG: hypothetical protein ACC656_05120 [Candidatus Heimdallarchaeota archaeon]